MKNAFRFLLLALSVFTSTNPLHAQWSQTDPTRGVIKMQTFNNSHRTISDSSQTIQIKAVFKDFSKASTNSSGILKNIAVSRNPVQVVITNDNKFAFVRCFLSNTVELIDISQGKVIKSFSVPSPNHLSISNDGAKLIVASLTDSLINPNLYPDDCQLSIIFFPTGKSILTTIDIATQEMEKRKIIEIPSIRKILNSSNNDIIYLTSDFQILEVNIKDSTVNKRWEFSKQIKNAEIDRKNKRMFISDYSDSLKVLVLPNGPILSAPYGTSALCLSIAIDTLSNRIFVDGNFVGPGSNVLVFDAISLSQYTPITCDFALEDIVALPHLGKLYLCGFGGKTLELDYLTLNTRRIFQSSYNWHSMLYNNKNNKLYAFQYGGVENSSSQWSPSTNLDLIEYDINTDQLFQYNTTDSQYGCSYGRTIAMTSNESIVIATNSPENTISILYLDQATAIAEDLKNETYSLSQNYPNPFNPTTMIKYSIPHASLVNIQIYDILGKEVVTLINEMKSAGTYTATFNPVNMPSGVYFYRLQAGSFTETKKLVLFR